MVRQVVVELQGPGREPVIHGYEMGKPVAEAVPGNWRVTTPKDGTYVLEALVPLAFFGIPDKAESFLVDVGVTAAPCAGQKPQFLWLYSPQFAFAHNQFFGEARLADAAGGNRP